MNIDPSLPTATLLPLTTTTSTTTSNEIQPPNQNSTTSQNQFTDSNNSLAPLLHPPPLSISFSHKSDELSSSNHLHHHRFTNSTSSKRTRHRTSLGLEDDHSGDSSYDSDSESSDNQDQDNLEDEGALGSRSARAGTAERSKNKKKHKSKRKKRSFRSSNPSDMRTSVDTIQLAHAVALIQAQQQATTFYGTGSPNILGGLGVSPSNHSNANPPSGSQSTPNNQQQPLTEREVMSRIEAAVNPLKVQIAHLKSQVDTLERQRQSAVREMTSTRDLLTTAFKKIEALTGNAHESIDNGAIEHSAFDPQISGASGQTPPPGLHVNVLDIPVVLPSNALQNTLPNPHLSHMIAHSNHHDESRTSLLSHHLGNVNPLSSAAILRSGSLSRFDHEEPLRRSTPKKSGLPTSVSFTNPHSLLNKVKKHRRPELSRTVRATVFRLMGISSNASPSASMQSMHHEPKFGNEKSRAYHGYTTTPCFPEYTDEDLIDPVTQVKIWRWDWSKTIRQSPNNTAFAKEIRNVIVSEVEDTSKAMHTDVPIGDWEYLDDAIDSAYTNMRRERENQIDPTKMVKKEVHRARNKKRGLKEDKCKRRKKALDEYRSDPASFISKMKDLDIILPDRPPITSSSSDQTQKTLEEEILNSWEESLDLKYMSSEDEAHLQDFENPISVGPERPESSLSLSDKIFAICRPGWRSNILQNLFTFLDAIKQPERAYRRVLGSTRQNMPPAGTPPWRRGFRIVILPDTLFFFVTVINTEWVMTLGPQEEVPK
ncbi:uncharacterized protein MELLADRAFT_86387 [Melampsora larici-populina 98AG31]|uniref:Uncharacterized protein n=1 Tax=Melampsora larici-populina (strain 98AG31 / pathotype 3-4-7) TaxID=747676 RepID=F4RLM1_MELLP|nr:uncharacterized protein MELLADRAFT_86387 [Melampsora larici-populina 98AG31]EGG06724.1 hypothetical protein MELLADRAFT_86387 [Melampsora larici-populina 98AG31]